jgi:AraC-like DNA-binding protein
MIHQIIKAPQGLTDAPYYQSALTLKGLSVIESCTHNHGTQGRLFLEHHLLLFVLKGNYTIRYAGSEHVVRENQMVLLHKSIALEYEKSGQSDDGYLLEYMMFFLKDELLKEFITMLPAGGSQPVEAAAVTILPLNDRLSKYLESLKPYFAEPESIEDGLIRLKLLELLYDVAHANPGFMSQLLQLKQQVRVDISSVVEENLLNPVSLIDLAYLSGRSLSSFKRDFQSIYNTPPSKWIRQRRLDKARELLQHKSMSVTDVCYMTGFESVAHFSKVFKERFGFPPTVYRQRLG